MIIDWGSSLTLTNILLSMLVFLVGVLILYIRALTTVFYEDFVMGTKNNILNNQYREMLNFNIGMNRLVEDTQRSSSDLNDIREILHDTREEVLKLTRNIHRGPHK